MVMPENDALLRTNLRQDNLWTIKVLIEISGWNSSKSNINQSCVKMTKLKIWYQKKKFFFKFLIWIYPLQKKTLKFCFRYELQKMFVFIITQMEIRNNLLHLSRVMTRPVQYTYNRCQFVTRSWFIYAIRWARYFFLDSRSQLIHQIKIAHLFIFYLHNNLVYWGKCIVCCKFQVFFVWIFSNSYFFYLPVHVFY